MISNDLFRDVMAGIPSPVTVLTTDDGTPAGATVGAFMSLSLEPQLVLASLMTTTGILDRIRRAGRFGVNLLADHQEGHARAFASRVEDRFAGVTWSYDSGLPRLDEAAAWMVCELENEIPAGDHVLIVGRPILADVTRASALTYYRRSFGAHRPFEELMPAML